jgi:hypothetical protein
MAKGKKGGGKGKKGKGSRPSSAEPPPPAYVPPPRPPTPPPRHTELPADVRAAAFTGDRARVAAWLGDEEYGHVDATFERSGRTMLMAAARGGQPAIAAMCVHHGADVNAQDMDGNTALHLGASQALKGYGSHEEHDKVVRYLLQQGARRDLANKQGAMANTVINPQFAAGAAGLLRPPSRVIRVF